LVSAKTSGTISIQVLWLFAILVFLLLGVSTRALISVKASKYNRVRVQAEVLLDSYSAAFVRSISMSDSMSCNYLGRCANIPDSLSLLLGEHSFTLSIEPGLFSHCSKEIAAYDSESRINITSIPEWLSSKLGLTLHAGSHSEKNIDGSHLALLNEVDIWSDSSWDRSVILDKLIQVGGIEVANVTDDCAFTIFGDGQLNFNTASRGALEHTGCPESLIQKLEELRSHKGEESTNPIFLDPSGIIATFLNLGLEVTQEEAEYLDLMYEANLIGVRSQYFSYTAQCSIDNSPTVQVRSETAKRDADGDLERIVRMRFIRKLSDS